MFTMPTQAPTALDLYRDAQGLCRTTQDVLRLASLAAASADLAAREARLAAVLSVACPYCAAEAGEPCVWPAPGDLHRNVTHGLRDDASGVNG